MKVHGNLDIKGVLTEQGQPVAGTVTFTDGKTTKTADTLHFAEDDFYVTGSTSGGVVLNLGSTLFASMSDNSGVAQILSVSAVKTFDTSVSDNGGWIDLVNNQFIIPSGLQINRIKCLSNATFSSTGNASRRRIFIQIDKLDGNGFQDPPGLTPNESKVANTSDVTQMQLTSHIISVKEGWKVNINYAEEDVGTVNLPANGSNWFQIEKVK